MAPLLGLAASGVVPFAPAGPARPSRRVRPTVAKATGTVQGKPTSQACRESQAVALAEVQQVPTLEALVVGTAGLLAPLLLDVDAASAGSPLLTGRTVSLVHPAIMIFLFFATGYTGWLGLQWRRARTIPEVVRDLKADLPPKDAEGKRPPSPLDAQIKELEDERKALLKGNYKEVHHNWGSLLLGVGVLIGVVGPVNTYLRAGKLFPGPHLYAGAGIVVLWALAASLVPPMSKGSEAARTAHITLNCLNLALFAWQLPTGFDIVQKVWTNVPWP